MWGGGSKTVIFETHHKYNVKDTKLMKGRYIFKILYRIQRNMFSWRIKFLCKSDFLDPMLPTAISITLSGTLVKAVNLTYDIYFKLSGLQNI